MTDGTPEICSQCGGGPYTNIFQHWASPHTGCERPAPSDDEQSIIIGLWLSGVDIQSLENSKYPNLVKYSTNRALLEWVAEELGMWVKDAKVMEIRSADEQTGRLHDEFGGDHDAKTLYAVRVRPSSLICDLQDAASVDIELTRLAARVFYAFRGRIEQRAYEIFFNHPEGEDVAAMLQRNGFEATMHSNPEHGIYRVRIPASEARRFAGWLGGDASLPGCEEKFRRLATLTPN